ncbi:MAG: tRNA epoxyqueuosine(34) reductase QueG [Gemmatimonadaceae bacterium]|jgi:epoxyqueuosine reductase
MISAVESAMSIESLIKAQAYGLGFDLVGITSLGPVGTAPAFEKWLSQGYSGEMGYLARGAEKRRDSRLPLPNTTHAIVVGLNYGGREAAGPIARYARGDDYHDVITAKLDDLRAWLESEIGRPVASKPYVDTGPILERDLARRAGLGWFGKNTNLVNPKLGSFFFIGALLVNLDLKDDAPFEGDRCGTCTRCLDACPTDAFVEHRVLDATRCISYLTIENKDGIPERLRPAVGEMIYGCDICQDVCPWNITFSQDLREEALKSRPMFVGRTAREQALELLVMDDEAYRRNFRGSPMKRAKRTGLSRNAAVVLGNVGEPRDAAVLEASRLTADEMVAEHIDWALEKIAARADV